MSHVPAGCPKLDPPCPWMLSGPTCKWNRPALTQRFVECGSLPSGVNGTGLGWGPRVCAHYTLWVVLTTSPSLRTTVLTQRVSADRCM